MATATYEDRANAHLGNDGDTTTMFVGSTTKGAWWQLDLGARVEVRDVICHCQMSTRALLLIDK